MIYRAVKVMLAMATKIRAFVFKKNDTVNKEAKQLGRIPSIFYNYNHSGNLFLFFPSSFFPCFLKSMCRPPNFVDPTSRPIATNESNFVHK